MAEYNYQYFSGANVYIKMKPSDSNVVAETILECAGISYSVSNSQQPVYGYASTLYDAMLPGRTIVQGTFVVNYREPFYVEKKLGKGFLDTDDYYSIIEIGNYLFPLFDIEVWFGGQSKRSQLIRQCALISSGQTVQVNEQVVLQEYGFLGRHIIPLSERQKIATQD
jgi:hypothetical protein